MVESVLPTCIEWGPSQLTDDVTTIPERLDAVRAPPKDIYGRIKVPLLACVFTVRKALITASLAALDVCVSV